MAALPAHVPIAVVGAGFAGVGASIRLTQEGFADHLLLEQAPELGGTWWANTYPGCQCDVPSHLYSFSFAPNPGWSRTFSRQPEILAYLRDCAERFGVGERIRFGCELRAAAWDGRRWRLETSLGELSADVLVLATGALSAPAVPALPGLDGFAGTVLHSGAWDHGHDLAGERVAVIGTGASAAQLVPEIAPRVRSLHVFQRTPPWIVPHPDRPMGARARRLYAALPATQRAARAGVYWSREALLLPLRHPRLMGLLERQARRHLERQVPDPALRERLRPRYRMGCKRILLSNAYYPALQRPEVELVTEPIAEVRPHAIVTADGAERILDTIVLATGFRVSDPPIARRVRGRTGRTLAETWAGSPQAHRGTTVAGFPNLFVLVGPNTGLGHSSIVLMIESQLAYLAGALRTMRERRLLAVEPRARAQAAFNRRLQARMRGTVWTAGGCSSWYLDANGRNSALWPLSTWRFRLATRRFRPAEHVLSA